MGDFGQNPMANQGSGWSAPKAMGGGGGPPPFMNGPPGGGGFGGPPGGGGFGGPPRGGGFGGPRGGGFGGPPRGGGFGGGFGGPPGGFNGGGGFGGGGGFRGGFRGRGRGRGKPAPTNVVKKRKGYKGAAQKQKEPAKPSRQLFVRPIENGTKVSEVRDYFQVFGELRDVYLPKDYYTKEMKGVAYVEYKEQEDAEEAQAAMDGCEFNGKNISVTFAQGDRKSKETMATGVYATNMEIEMLKKELAKEQERLSKAARGERISPPRFAELDDNGAPLVKPMVKDDRDRRRGDRRDRDRRRRSRSRSPRRGLGGGRDRGPRDDEDDCPEFRKRPESDKDKIDDCPEFAGRPGRDDRSRSRRSSREPRSSRGDRDDRRDRDRDRDSHRRDRSRSRERRRSRDRR